MVSLILNKIMYLLFFLSTTNVVRHIFFFLIKISDQRKYEISKTALFYLGLSISMILTSIVTGIKL
jgi:hypothetical protein